MSLTDLSGGQDAAALRRALKRLPAKLRQKIQTYQRLVAQQQPPLSPSGSATFTGTPEALCSMWNTNQEQQEALNEGWLQLEETGHED